MWQLPDDWLLQRFALVAAFFSFLLVAKPRWNMPMSAGGKETGLGYSATLGDRVLCPLRLGGTRYHGYHSARAVFADSAHSLGS
mmetsp:Transcript_4470/g.10144  ORF Transcript_4470/g.10144 Transcript_4470/m.10144 type:complete len:84 (+) Transcript_4470:644-895(+)